MNSQEIFVALAGGHQHSSGIALTREGRIACVPYERINLHTQNHNMVAFGINEIVRTLGEKLEIGAAELKKRICRVAIALPGIATPLDRSEAEFAMQWAKWNSETQIRLLDDTRAGLLGGALQDTGICAIANSGASVLAVLNWGTGDYYKFDGWGSIIGDFGSGFDATQSLFRFLGRQRPIPRESRLFNVLMHHINLFQKAEKMPVIDSLDDVQWWFDELCKGKPNDWRYHFASLASVVTSLAEPPVADPDAIEIVQHCGKRIATTILSAVKLYPTLVENREVCCQGGMFDHSEVYMQAAQDSLASSGVRLERGRFRPLVGALLLALSEKDELPSPEIQRWLEERLATLPVEDKKYVSPKYKRQLGHAV